MSLFTGAITPTGYVRVPMTGTNSIESALQTLWATAYPLADLDARSPDGQAIGGLSEMFSDLEGAVADLYAGLANPNGATSQMLTNIAGINGIQRNPGLASYVPVQFAGTPSTPIPTGTLIQSTLADGTIAKWSNVYTLSGGVQTPGATIGGGGTSANAWAICTVLGAIQCPAATPLSLLSVIPGVTSVTVVSNATLGYLSEGDPNVRIRRQNSFGLATQGMADGLDSALNNMPADVIQAAVWENNTDIVQNLPGGGTLNPRSIRVIVALQSSPDVSRVVNKIYALKAPGCGMMGGQTSIATDEQGNWHTILWDLAVPQRILVDVLLITRSGWPSDGAQQIANLIGTWSANAQNHPLGGDSAGQLSWTAVLGAFVGQVPGFDLINGGMKFGAATSPPTWGDVGANYPLTFQQYGLIAATDVYINGIAAFPLS